jgi:hypothetical protein
MGVRQSVAARTLRATPGSKARRGEAAQKRWAVCYTNRPPCNTDPARFVRSDTDRPGASCGIYTAPRRRDARAHGASRSEGGPDGTGTRAVEPACGHGAGPRPGGTRPAKLPPSPAGIRRHPPRGRVGIGGRFRRGQGVGQGRVVAAGVAGVQDSRRLLGRVPGPGATLGRQHRGVGGCRRAEGAPRAAPAHDARGGHGRQPRQGRGPHGQDARPRGAHLRAGRHGRGAHRGDRVGGGRGGGDSRHLRRSRRPLRGGGRRALPGHLGHLVARLRRRAALGDRWVLHDLVGGLG